MQLVHCGPDIPERLLQAHEDGRVMFFCGAGMGEVVSLAPATSPENCFLTQNHLGIPDSCPPAGFSKGRVRTAAFAYAERLMAACDGLSALKQTTV